MVIYQVFIANEYCSIDEEWFFTTKKLAKSFAKTLNDCYAIVVPIIVNDSLKKVRKSCD